MSLAAEIAFARIAAAVGRGGAVALLSEAGVGSPLLESAGPVKRIALRPTGGFRRRPVCVYSPPSTPAPLAPRFAARPLLVDATRDGAVALLGAAARLRPTAPDAIRVRGGLGGATPAAGMVRAMADQEGREEIWLREDHATVLADAMARLERREGDELDVFAGMAPRAGFELLEHRAWGARAHLAPIAALDLPDETQIASALGAARARFDAGGHASFAIPRLSAAPGRIGVKISGLPAGAEDPVMAEGPPQDWRVTTDRDGEVWRMRSRVGAVREIEEFVISVPAALADNVSITAVWTGAARSAGKWDDWDEADALLTLEESW